MINNLDKLKKTINTSKYQINTGQQKANQQRIAMRNNEKKTEPKEKHSRVLISAISLMIYVTLRK